VSGRGSSPDPAEQAVELGGPFQQIRLIVRLLRDERVSGFLKLIPVGGLLYLVWPVDLIPDLFLPGLGQLDDLAIVLLSLRAFVGLCPQGLVREHLEKMAGRRPHTAVSAAEAAEPFIEVPYRVVEKSEATAGGPTSPPSGQQPRKGNDHA